jgi:hypothetical protein
VKATWNGASAGLGRRDVRLVVAKLDRPARSVPDARDIVDELTKGYGRGRTNAESSQAW